VKLNDFEGLHSNKAEDISKYNFGIAAGDKVTFVIKGDSKGNATKRGSGIVIKEYRHCFLIDLGKYKECVGKNQLFCKSHVLQKKG